MLGWENSVLADSRSPGVKKHKDLELFLWLLFSGYQFTFNFTCVWLTSETADAT